MGNCITMRRNFWKVWFMHFLSV